MPTTKAKDYRGKDDAALNKELASLQRRNFDLRTQAVVEKLDDPSQLGKTRRDIARIKTLLRERELGLTKTTK